MTSSGASDSISGTSRWNRIAEAANAYQQRTSAPIGATCFKGSVYHADPKLPGHIIPHCRACTDGPQLTQNPKLGPFPYADDAEAVYVDCMLRDWGRGEYLEKEEVVNTPEVRRQGHGEGVHSGFLH